MVRLQVPYHKVLLQPRDFEPGEFDDLLKYCLSVSCNYPLILETFNSNVQYLLFMREGQLYWAAVNSGSCFNAIKLRDFFTNLNSTQFPQIIVYYTDLVLYHSLLVYLQKKPELKVSSSLVDLDELLDKIEKDQKSALVSAYQPGNLLLLRYQEGKAVACYNGQTAQTGEEIDIREDYLVKVYTLAAHQHFDINIFTDLVVTHAEDAHPVPSDFSGKAFSLYESQPPLLVVKLKDRPLKTYPFTGKEMTIGRLPQNDIVIDNLSVSRNHAVVSSTKSGFTITDLGSKNGTFLNGKQIDKAELHNGDTIAIGKYQITFKITSSEGSCMGELDQTVIIPNFHQFEQESEFSIHYPITSGVTPRLYRISNNDEIALQKERTVIGKGKNSDIRLPGFFIPRVTVEIRQEGADFVLQKVIGRDKVRINGEEMDEKVLETEDLITIGAEEFVFKR